MVKHNEVSNVFEGVRYQPWGVLALVILWLAISVGQAFNPRGSLTTGTHFGQITTGNG